MNEYPTLDPTTAPTVFVLIPGKDFLVIFNNGEIPLPDAEVLDELQIQADQRCAPETLGTISDVMLTVAETVASGALTSAVTATYPALGRYVDHVKKALHRSRDRRSSTGSIDTDPTPAPATTPEVTRRARIALEVTVGEPTTDPVLGPDSATQALRATVTVDSLGRVEVRIEPTVQLLCITVPGTNNS